MRLDIAAFSDVGRRKKDNEDSYVVVREGTKGYHHKWVDEENKEGFFLSYKQLTQQIADLLLEINPDFNYPKATASMLIETANNNLYFARHLPRLTDLTGEGSNLSSQITKMLEFYAFNLLQQKPEMVMANK